MVRGQSGHQRAEAVGVLPVEVGPLRQRPRHPDRAPGRGSHRLDREELVHDQPVVREPRLHLRERLGRPVHPQQRGERAHPFGHVAGLIPQRAGTVAAVEPGQQRQRLEPQSAAARRARVGRVGSGFVHRDVDVGQRRLVRAGKVGREAFARGVDRIGVGDDAAVVQPGRDLVLGRQAQDKRGKGRIGACVGQEPADRADIGRARVRVATRAGHQRIERKAAPGFPAGEGVGVVRQKRGARGLVQVVAQHDWGGKPAQRRHDRARAQPFEPPGAGGRVEFQHLGWALFVAVRTDQADRHRDHPRGLVGLARGRPGVLRQGDRQRAARLGFVPGLAQRHLGRAGVCVPAGELGQVAPRGVLEHLQPVLDRAGLPVVAVEIQVQRRAIVAVADQALQHPDHLGALFVNGRGVEVVDFLIPVGARRMGKRPRILAELACAQCHHVLDPLHRGRAHVRRELLVTEHRQPFLQAQLEPVAAGDPVAGPVVEIFVRDHRLDPLVVGVGRRVGRGEDQLGVEDVQPLVLHRAHVEVVHRDDVEHVQVVFAAIDALVPQHRLLQRLHRKARARQVARADPDVQRDIAAGHRGELVGQRLKLARDQREQIGGLGPGVVPFGKPGLGRHGVAVRQQHRHRRRDLDAERRHHVGPVGIPGDVAEPLGLALGAEDAPGQIQPLERGVPLGVDLDGGGQGKGAFGQGGGGNRQRLVAHVQHRGIGFCPVDPQRQGPQPGPVQHQIGAGDEGAEVQFRLDPRRDRGKVEPQPRLGQRERKGLVVGQ